MLITMTSTRQDTPGTFYLNGTTYDLPDALAYQFVGANVARFVSNQSRVVQQGTQTRFVFPSVRDFGAAGDGVTDDTRAFADALASGQPVLLPRPDVAYIVGDCPVVNGAALIGYAGGNYSSILGGPVVRRLSGAAAVFDTSGSRNTRFAGFTIDGVNRSCNGIVGDETSGHLVLEHMDFRNLDSGLGDASYIRTVKATNCVFYGNNVGIRNPIDSIVFGGFVAASITNGIQCGAGSNGNTFIGVKLEWNANNGISFFDSVSNSVVGGVIDRNYHNGVLIQGSSSNISISGPTFIRNGRNDTTAERAHVRVANTASHVTVTGITTRTGTDDGGGGPLTPQYGIDIATATCDTLVIAGNDLTGCTIAGGGLRYSVYATNVKASGNAGAMDIRGVQSIVSAASTTVLDETVEEVVITGATTHTLTLPACRTGRILRVTNTSTGTVTINRAGSDTINGSATGLSVTAGQVAQLLGNANTNWVGKAF